MASRRRRQRKPKGAWDDPKATKAERQAEYEAFHRTQEGFVVRPIPTNKGRFVWAAYVMPRFDALGRTRKDPAVGLEPPYFTTARKAVQALRKREGRPDLPAWTYIDREAFEGTRKVKDFETNPSEHMLQLVANGWEEGQLERLIHRAAQLHSFGMTRLEIAEQLADEGISREDAALAAAAGQVYAQHEFEEHAHDED